VTHLIERFTEFLKKGKYNSATIASYRNDIFVFYNHFRDYPQSKITDELIAEYLKLLDEKKSSRHEVIQAGKAIKLFYEVIFNRKLSIKATGKEKEIQTIDVLSQTEIKLLIDTVKNIKHKALLILVYNSGMKISEVIKLRISDIDFKKYTITLKHKNSKKDRLLRLSPNIVVFIEKYIKKYEPVDVLFPGSGGEGFYSSRNIQMFFQKALTESGLNKQATLNTLRHSFAVHSLEMGLDIHILQQMLGHTNIQTTSVYNQFVKIKTEQIISPLEKLDLEIPL
jgi:integrase/recombinase XerD